MNTTFNPTTAPAKKQGHAAWFTELTPPERSTFIATFGGWALDGMDVMVYSFVIPSLIAAWHITKGEAGMLGTAALLISAVGGWLAGLLADRFGRARVLQWTILWFALFTFLSGFTNNFWQLLITRGLSGPGLRRGVGGRLGADGRDDSRRASGQSRGYRAGWLGHRLGNCRDMLGRVVLMASRRASPGAPCSGLAFCPRSWSSTFGATFPSPRFTPGRAKSSPPVATSLISSRSFLRRYLKITLLTSLLGVGVQGGYYAITTWLPTYLKTVRHLSVLNTGRYMIVIIAGSFCGYLTGAYLADSIGRKKALILFAACCALAVTAYTYLPISNGIVMLLLGFPLGFFTSGSFSPVGAFFTELFPSRLRGSGQGFSYNLGRGIGALFPTLVGFLSARLSLGKAIAIFAVSAYVVMILAVLLLPETKGKELRVYE